MRLMRAKLQSYRSIRDTGWFEVERDKTILVGPNEAGKTALLRALQQINPPTEVQKFDALRDYPRALYNDITTKKVDPSQVTVAQAVFSLDEGDKKAIADELKDVQYEIGRYMDNKCWHRLLNAPSIPTYGSVKKDLARLCAHIDPRVKPAAEGAPPNKLSSEELAKVTNGWEDAKSLTVDAGKALQSWLDRNAAAIAEDDEKEGARFDKLITACRAGAQHAAALAELHKRLPVFVLFSNYFRVRPLIHLDHLASRLEQRILDDDQYDYGNQCLLKLLGFAARELSNLGKATEPKATLMR